MAYLTVSSMLKGYVEWPYAEQISRLEWRFLHIRDGKVEVVDVPDARRYYAANLDEAVSLLLLSPI